MKPSIVCIVLFSGLIISLLVGGVSLSGRAQAQTEPLTIESNKTAYSEIGETIMFYYTLKNTSGEYLHNLVFTDNFGKVPCSANNLDPRMVTGCTRAHTVTQEDITKGYIEVTAAVTGDYTVGGCFGTKSEQVNYTATFRLNSTVPVRVFTPNPVLNLTVAGDPASFSGPGEVVTYSYTLTNAGNVALTAPFSINDTHALVTCPAMDTLDPNASLTCTASYTTTAEDVLAGKISSTAIAHARYQEDTKLYSVESASITTEILLDAQPALDLVKTANPTCFSNLGEIIQFTFTITNTGNVPLEGPFQVLDSYILLSSVSCPDTAHLDVGETIICSASYQTKSGDMAAGFWNRAVVQVQYNAQTVTSNEATIYVCYNPPFTAMPDQIDCSQFTVDDTCLVHPECAWDYDDGVCRNGP